MKKLLVTAFEPFGGRAINAAREAVLRLPEKIGERKIARLILPVEFTRAAETAIAEAEKLAADAVVCVGEAVGRKAVTPERRAVNLRRARIPDNAGAQPQNEPILPGGAEELFSTLPLSEMVRAIREAGFPAEISESAGEYVCNDLFYLTAAHFVDRKADDEKSAAFPCGFIHLPGEEVLSHEDAAECLRLALACL